MRDAVFVLVVVLACAVGFYRVSSVPAIELPPVKPMLSTATAALQTPLPDFAGFSDVTEKKAAFFSYLLPLVETENQRIAELRRRLLTLHDRIDHLTEAERQWLFQLARYYRALPKTANEQDIDNPRVMETLLRRVDQVPPSLALAQAATESGWGTSRFAVEGNNLFGQWCFKPGCGLVPDHRPEEKAHEVAKFSSPLHSVQRYIHNLNTHFAYREFRNYRGQLRKEQQPIFGKEIATTLINYSARGEAYVGEVMAMIESNGLEQYDTI